MAEEKESYWKKHSSYYTNEKYRFDVLRKGRDKTFKKHMLKIGCHSYDSYVEKVIEASFDQVTSNVFVTNIETKVSSQAMSGYGIAEALKIQHLTMLKLLGMLFDSEVIKRNNNRYYSLMEYLILAELMYAYSVRGAGSLKGYEREIKLLCKIATRELEKQIKKHGGNVEGLDLGFNKRGGKDEYVNRVKRFRENILQNTRVARILSTEKREQEKSEMYSRL
ncbi:hypothetical protein [Prochlorococcus sp. ALOHA_ZT_50]|jgi:hypothetical protein|uniref:hypothetical protein n=1 Tax=Prochlorococcus sp. ALOHA_ZT_50 TaxID=2919303 RepID=UPI00257AE048|nr:hypothetical protein [Prochlorococcus sp. ALOHA_ZT_50]MCH2079606.1 hypothetical protein [Prochlorococcus sp. ALOHA_ZT_50]